MHQELQTDHSTEHEPLATATEALAPSVLSEDLALSQLNNREITADAIEKIAQNAGIMKSRKVRMALVSHPRTPRRIALRVIRELYTFELMQLAMLPGTAGDLRRVADELLLSRLPSVTLGERISLARRSSGRIAGALLLDKETPVWQAALENPRLTEGAIVKALQRSTGVPAFVESVSHHAKWSVRPEIRMALLRNAHTPFARAIEFARRIPSPQLRDILHTSRLPERIKEYLNNQRRKATV